MLTEITVTRYAANVAAFFLRQRWNEELNNPSLTEQEMEALADMIEALDQADRIVIE